MSSSGLQDLQNLREEATGLRGILLNQVREYLFSLMRPALMQVRAERDGSFFGMIGWAGTLVLYPDLASCRAGAEVEACQVLQPPPWRGPTPAQQAMRTQFSPRVDATLKKPQTNSLLALAWHPVGLTEPQQNLPFKTRPNVPHRSII